VHAPLFHPVIAAKEMVTADHIGNGRFGLNVVAGWNEGEFQMFGVAQREHDERYEFAQEWLNVIKRAWSAEEFDFAGRYFKLAGVRAKPGPVGRTRPIIMNAGQSGAGQAFAMRNCDAFFTSTKAARLAVAGTSDAGDGEKIFNRIVKQVSDIKAEGRKHGREIDVYTQGQVICRPTQREAEEYHHYANVECADWGAIDRMLALKNITAQNTPADEFKAKRTMLASTGVGGYPFVGTPDQVAAEFANLGRAGFRGLAVSFVNYLNDVPYFCDEVLPRLARMGLRATH
jgi:alkanesulfonate monooxygenase SsuD/methylene tetrahydromethanopterin reductase-like flavin-dependent oxidoreductase (luciferase family)